MLHVWWTLGLLLCTFGSRAAVPDYKSMGADRSMCEYACNDVTKKLMKDFLQCSMRCVHHAGAFNNIPDDDFHSKLSAASGMCRMADCCITEPQARHLLYNCLQQEAEITGHSTQGHRRAKRTIAEIAVLWSTDRPITYSFDEAYNEDEKALIENALDRFRSNTCLRFDLTTNTTHEGINFSRGISCSSYLGRSRQSPQNLELAAFCLASSNSLGISLHQILHALGVIHENSRTDRDQFITVYRNNIVPGLEMRFNIIEGSTTNTQYDFHSVMHLKKMVHSIDSRRTIEPKDARFISSPGQERQLSFLDLLGLNLVYCADTCSDAQISCMNGGYPNPADCTKCICPPTHDQPDNQCRLITSNNEPECGAVQMRILTVNTPETNITMVDYSKEFTCAWRVQGLAGYTLSVNATGEFNPFSSAGDCIFQWLEIYDEKKTFAPVPRYCRDSQPVDVQFDTTGIIIVLTSTYVPASPTGRFTLQVSLANVPGPSLDLATVIGGAVAGVAVLVIIIVIIFIYMRKRRKNGTAGGKSSMTGAVEDREMAPHPPSDYYEQPDVTNHFYEEIVEPYAVRTTSDDGQYETLQRGKHAKAILSKWLVDNNIDRKTKETLTHHGIVTVGDVERLTHPDMIEMGLNVGERNRLKEAILGFQVPGLYDNDLP